MLLFLAAKHQIDWVWINEIAHIIIVFGIMIDITSSCTLTLSREIPPARPDLTTQLGPWRAATDSTQATLTPADRYENHTILLPPGLNVIVCLFPFPTIAYFSSSIH